MTQYKTKATIGVQVTRTIGIVGGMGPLAGIDLASKILRRSESRNDQSHPAFLLASNTTPVPDRTEYLLRRSSTNPAHAIINTIHDLIRIGAEVIGIPCNTAHAPKIFSPVCQQLSRLAPEVEIVNMVQCVEHDIGQREIPFANIGILCTHGTYDSGTYTKALRSRDINPIYPDATMREQVNQAIYDQDYGMKGLGESNPKKARLSFYRAIEQLESMGAQAVILGCSEIALLIQEEKYHDLELLDPTNILAGRLLERAGLSQSSRRSPFVTVGHPVAEFL